LVEWLKISGTSFVRLPDFLGGRPTNSITNYSNRKYLVIDYSDWKLVTKFIVSITTRFMMIEWHYFLSPVIVFWTTQFSFWFRLTLYWPDVRLCLRPNASIMSWQKHETLWQP
jgi:hypothetical protein